MAKPRNIAFGFEKVVPFPICHAIFEVLGFFIHISYDALIPVASPEKCLETCPNVSRPDRSRGGDGGVGREGRGEIF